jgi:hypothetical protein
MSMELVSTPPSPSASTATMATSRYCKAFLFCVAVEACGVRSEDGANSNDS